jgi:hypothetical protein
MVPLNSCAFVILTGNGLTVSEDLARRFIEIELDPRIEDPETRPFKGDIRNEVVSRRPELLAALLTIWRWGRIARHLKVGLPLGSFTQWCQGVRDPLLSLNCCDPVARVGEAKKRDSRRQVLADLFTVWWDKHREEPVTANQLHDDVKKVADPQVRGRQYLASRLEKLTGTRIAGFVLTRQESPGKWGVATYALSKTSGYGEHRGHRGHGPGDLDDGDDRNTGNGRATQTPDPEPPMPPMPSSTPWQTRL